MMYWWSHPSIELSHLSIQIIFTIYSFAVEMANYFFSLLAAAAASACFFTSKGTCCSQQRKVLPPGNNGAYAAGSPQPSQRPTDVFTAFIPLFSLLHGHFLLSNTQNYQR